MSKMPAYQILYRTPGNRVQDVWHDEIGFRRSRDSYPHFEWFCQLKDGCIFIESEEHTRHPSSNTVRWSDSWSMRCGERKLEINQLENSRWSAHFFLPGGCSEIWSWYMCQWGTLVAQLLRCCATNRKVSGSIPAGVSGFLIDIISFRSHSGPGVDSASNRNEYQEYFMGVKAAGA